MMCLICLTCLMCSCDVSNVLFVMCLMYCCDVFDVFLAFKLKFPAYSYESQGEYLLLTGFSADFLCEIIAKCTKITLTEGEEQVHDMQEPLKVCLIYHILFYIILKNRSCIILENRSCIILKNRSCITSYEMYFLSSTKKGS